MSDTSAPVDEPDDGGRRPSSPTRDQRDDEGAGTRAKTEAPDRPVGDFGEADQADPGGDSDTGAAEGGG
jgi:hypothetical protein